MGQNKVLKDRINTTTSMGDVRSPFERGDVAKPFMVYLNDGSTKRIEFAEPERRHLLFILATNCPHCEKNLPKWNAITEQSKSTNFDVLGVSISKKEATQKYVADKDVRFYLSAIADSTFLSDYRISGVPLTLIVKSDGTVEQSWLGELSDKHVDEVSAYLKSNGSIN